MILLGSWQWVRPQPQNEGLTNLTFGANAHFWVTLGKLISEFSRSGFLFVPKAVPNIVECTLTEETSFNDKHKRLVGLRFKVTSIVSGSFLILFLTQFAVVKAILLRNFTQLEEDNALVNATRIQNGLSAEILRINDAVVDYSTWDDTYHFVEGRNPDYIKSQLYDSIFVSLKINMVGIVNRSGKLLVQKGIDFYKQSPISPPVAFLSYISPKTNDLSLTDLSKTQGVLSSSAGPILVTSQPILKNEGKSLKNGTMSMGRFIDPQMIKHLSDTTQLPIRLYDYEDASLPQEIQNIIQTKLKNTEIATQVLSDEVIASYVRVNDVFGKPAIILKAENNRKIYAQGLHSLNYYFWSTFVLGVIFCGLVLVLLERFILSRLSRLSQGVSAIGEQGAFSARVYIQGQDELAHLAKTINHTLTKLQQAQQSLQNSEERYILAVRGAKDGVWDWNLLNNEFFFSERLQDILGYEENELKQSVLMCLDDHHPHYLPALRTAIEEHLQGLTPYLKYEQRVTLKDGTERWVLCRGSAVVDSKGKPYRMAGSLTDISELKATAQIMARQTQELVRSNEELEQFAYIASHDLQEPLRKIEAFGDRLKLKYDKLLDKQGLDYLARQQNAASRMRILLQDLLAFSRVSTQSREFTKLSLSTLLEEVLGDLEVRIQETNAQVTVDPMPTLEADALQMRQLFQNLIGNALKFQKPGEPPKISIQCSKNENAVGAHQVQTFYHITVEDNGIGFDEKYLDRIFKVFQRLHGRAEYEGTGIGLAVCAKIVERHGGKLTAQSTPGQGAKFIVSLPVQQPNISSS